MAFDFPSPAAVNQTVTMPDGTQRSWDGTKWRQAGLAPGPYLPLSGGSLTGPLVLAADPTSAMQAATKEYVDAEALNNTGRSLIHNGLFTVAQRGTGPWTAGPAYTADRWIMTLTNDTLSVSVQPLADADRTAIGDEQALWALQAAFTGSATAGSASVILQRLENVRRVSGKPVTLSFWAKASSGTPRLGLALNENFGTGGSPSPIVLTYGPPTAALTATWTRYTMSLTVPSAAGKTFGTTAGTDFSVVGIYLSDQSNASGIGVQSGTVQLWGIQLELGTIATPLAKRDPADELSLCQRFYQSHHIEMNQIPNASAIFSQTVLFPVQLRASPTIAFSNTTYGNASAINSYAVDGRFVKVGATATAAGAANFASDFTASADL